MSCLFVALSIHTWTAGIKADAGHLTSHYVNARMSKIAVIQKRYILMLYLFHVELRHPVKALWNKQKGCNKIHRGRVAIKFSILYKFWQKIYNHDPHMYIWRYRDIRGGRSLFVFLKVRQRRPTNQKTTNLVVEVKIQAVIEVDTFQVFTEDKYTIMEFPINLEDKVGILLDLAYFYLKTVR